MCTHVNSQYFHRRSSTLQATKALEQPVQHHRCHVKVNGNQIYVSPQEQCFNAIRQEHEVGKVYSTGFHIPAQRIQLLHLDLPEMPLIKTEVPATAHGTTP